MDPLYRLQQSNPLPVALSLDLPLSPHQDLPVLSIPCTRTEPSQPRDLSWSELLGER